MPIIFFSRNFFLKNKIRIESFNADKKVSSLDQFLSHMNKEVIFDSFPGIGNVIVSDVVRVVSYHETIIQIGITFKKIFL